MRLLCAERLRAKEALQRGSGWEGSMRHAVVADDGFALGAAFLLQARLGT